MSAEFVRSWIKAPLLCCLLTSGLAERKPDTSRKQLPLRIWTLITVWSALRFHLCGRGSVTVQDGRIKSPVFVNSSLSFGKMKCRKVVRRCKRSNWGPLWKSCRSCTVFKTETGWYLDELCRLGKLTAPLWQHIYKSQGANRSKVLHS